MWDLLKGHHQSDFYEMQEELNEELEKLKDAMIRKGGLSRMWQSCLKGSPHEKR